MSCIMTKDGWRQLLPVCTNETWETMSWDPADRKYVSDLNGRLMKTAVVTHVVGLIKEAPPIYRGRLPSPEAEAYCLRLQAAVDESRAKRAGVF